MGFVAKRLAISAFTYDPDNLQVDTETVTYNLPGHDYFGRFLDRSLNTLGRDQGWLMKNGVATERQDWVTRDEFAHKFKQVFEFIDSAIDRGQRAAGRVLTARGNQVALSGLGGGGFPGRRCALPWAGIGRPFGTFSLRRFWLLKRHWAESGFQIWVLHGNKTLGLG